MGRPSADIVTRTEYARHRGVSTVAVTKAIATGRIKLRKDGKLSRSQADRDWNDNTDTSKPRNSVNGRPKGNGHAPTSQPGTYAAARAEREQWQAKQAELDYKLAAGELVERAEVERDWFAIGRRVRDAVLVVPDRVAMEITGLTDAADVHRLLVKELRAALESIADDT